MRDLLKAGVEITIARSGVADLFRRRLRRRELILAYHGIVPHGERPSGEVSLHLPEAQFAAQLDVLGELSQVVALGDLLRPPSDSGNGPRVAITWDDAYVGTLITGVDAVVRRGMPATLFVAPGRLGGQIFWWDRLAEQSGGIVLPAARSRALYELSGEDDRITAAYWGDAGPRDIPDFARSAEESLLTEAAGRPGISVGSHSWSHPNLTAVGPERLQRELTEPARWLGERFASYLPWLAYPYGLHTPEVRGGAARAGYVAGLRVEGGWRARVGEDWFQVPRLNVSAGLSLDGFVLRLSGLLSR